MSNVLEAIAVHKKYNQAARDLHVLKGVDLKIATGDVVTIVGPSGAGKSTLLHIMGCLDKPTDGRVLLRGEDIYALNDEKRARMRNEKIGFVFQFYHLLAEFTALENVVLPLCVKEGQANSKKYKEQGMYYLEQVGLQERLSHKTNQLSGGEQQRVAIARALVNKPEIILCDEPTGNLDSETGKEIIDLLMKLNNKNKQTLVVVTHDESIAQYSNQSIKMYDGKLV